MIRTQVYLTSKERQTLLLLARETHTSQSAMIRQAIDDFISKALEKKPSRLLALQAAKGLWAKRDNLPDFTALRSEFDSRNFSKRQDEENDD